MAARKPVSVGIISTSWWADSMYLPALKDHPSGQVTAICGRNAAKAHKIAAEWGIPNVYTDYNEMIDKGGIDAVIVAARTDGHYPMTMKALDAGLHVLCEKPVAFNYAEANRMATCAQEKGVKTMVPFTYRFMPTNRYIKELISEGFIGTPYHLNLRYYHSYGRITGYDSRFDMTRSGPGAIADIGSHFLYLAEWFFGEITHVTAQLGRIAPRPSIDPDGNAYEIGDDNCSVLIQFANGAQGIVQASTVSYEGGPFGMTHHFELHGSEGTIYMSCDWNTTQRVMVARANEGQAQEVPIPDHIWGDARRDTVHNTYRDIFRKQDHMTRGWVTAIAEDKPSSPTLRDGANVQRLIDSAVISDREGRRVDVKSVT